MATGTVKWFNPTKGFGFIQPDDGGGDVFVHIDRDQKAELGKLKEGGKVAFELGRRDSGALAAEQLTVVAEK